MPQSKILLDSNAYFRLARSRHPLLFQSFGEANYTLYIIDDFQKELDRSRRLKTKFYWANLPEFRANREYSVTISRKEKKEINITLTYLKDYNISSAVGASDTDLKALATASVLNIPLVTDDAGMASIGDVFGIEIWGLLKLMKLMHANEFIDTDDAWQIVNYLRDSKDLPNPGFLKDFKKLFGSKD